MLYHRGSACRALFLLAALGALGVRPATAEDWYHWRGPEQTGASRDKDLPENWSPAKVGEKNLVWKTPIGGRSTPLVMKGRVFLINRCGDGGLHEQERVMCFDAKDGKVLWEHKFNVFFTDIVSNRLGWTNLAGDPETGNIYAHGTQGLLIGFDRDGKVLWEHSLTEEYGRITGYGGRVTSPTVDGDLVIIGMINSSWGDQAPSSNRYVAFDKRTGTPVWWSTLPGRATYYSCPVIAVINGERLLICGGPAGDVTALRVRTGEKVWSTVVCGGAINCSPVVEGSLVYIGHGETNPGSNVQGGVVCLDAGKAQDGKAPIVWKKEGIKAKYASAIVHDGRLYIPDESADLYCFDAKTGDRLWKFSYGRDCKGSPVWADGKIYVAEVDGNFHILAPGPKSCKRLQKVFCKPPDGGGVEMNGSPAVADGRIYFCTSKEMYCIGKPDYKAAPIAIERAKEPPADEKVAHLQVVPADVVLDPGESVAFKVRAFDGHGRFIKETKADFSVGPMPLPTPPPGAPPPPKGPTPPPLKGTITEDGKLTVEKTPPGQFGVVTAKAEGQSAVARVRVAPTLPYTQDFSKVPENRTPAGWINAQGKFAVVKLPDDSFALKKLANNNAPSLARANAYIGKPTLTNYTIEAEIMGNQARKDLPDAGIVANRYTLMLRGNDQELQLVSWDALPPSGRIGKSVAFPWKPGSWYHLKLTLHSEGDKTFIRGKAWPRGEKEPDKWTVEIEDPIPNRQGSPALYGYGTGILEKEIGAESFFANVRITPTKP
jgi:outer membrane protein assembly factor BamB